MQKNPVKNYQEVMFLLRVWALEFWKNLISSLSYGRYHLVPNRGTFWENFTPLRTFSCFHCFHFHYVLFFAISFQTPLKNPAQRAGGRKPEALVYLGLFFVDFTLACKVKYGVV